MATIPTLVDGLDFLGRAVAARWNPSKERRLGDPVPGSRDTIAATGEQARSIRQYRRDAPPLDNDAFIAVANFIAKGINAAKITLVPVEGGDPLDSHIFLDFMQDISPPQNTRLVMGGWSTAALDRGWGFQFKNRSASGVIESTRLVPSENVAMLVDQENGVDVFRGWRLHHEATPRGTSTDYPPMDVIPLWDSIDPRNPSRPLAAGDVLAASIFTDQERQRFTTTQLSNGWAGTAVAFKTDLTETVANARITEFTKALSGNNRGKSVAVGGDPSFHKVGMTSRELQMRELARLPEERICAVTGVNAIAAGLGAGLDRPFYNSYRDAFTAAYEQGVKPRLYLIADTLTRNLLWVDFDDARQYRVEFDTSEIKALANTHEQTLAEWNSDVIERDEARTFLGHTPIGGEQGSEFKSDGGSGGGGLGLFQRERGKSVPFRANQTPAEDLADALRRLQAARARALGVPLRDLLIAAAERAVARAAEAVAAEGVIPLASALYAGFADDIGALLAPSAEVTAEGVVAAINAAQVLPEPVDLNMATRLLVRARSTERVLEMQGSRIGQWQALINDRISLNWTPQQILDGGGPLPPELEGLKRPGLREVLGTEDYRGQAETIARTESAYSQAQTSLPTYAEQGVRQVLVMDGVDFDAPCVEANGQTWTLEQAAANPIAHPNCRRNFAPILPTPDE